MDYSDYYDYGYDAGYAAGSAFGNFLSICLSVLIIVGLWKLFKKAGYAGWESIVPFYNAYVLFDIVYGQGWYFLICLIPIAGWIFSLVTYYKLAGVYGKGSGFGIGLVFLPSIFLPILGFSKTTYYSGPSSRAMNIGVGGYNNFNGYNSGYKDGSFNNDIPIYGGNNPQGYPNNGYNQQAYGQQGYNQQGFNQQGYNQQQDYQNNGYQNNGFQNNGFQSQNQSQYNPFENPNSDNYYGNNSNYNSYNNQDGGNNNGGFGSF